jgi:hypothetical protein
MAFTAGSVETRVPRIEDLSLVSGYLVLRSQFAPPSDPLGIMTRNSMAVAGKPSQVVDVNLGGGFKVAALTQPDSDIICIAVPGTQCDGQESYVAVKLEKLPETRPQQPIFSELAVNS